MKRIELENGCFKKIYYWDFNDTKIKYEYYYNSKDKYHRLNGPAVIMNYRSGELKIKSYWIKGKKHRKKGPADIWYNRSGEIERECYYINNNCHRLIGPSQIWYNRSGEIDCESYYINDIIYSKEEFDKKINIERNLKLLNKK